MSTCEDRPESGVAAPSVRIRLAVGDVRMEFRGRQDFFERHVEPLMRAAYAHAGAAGTEEAGGDRSRASATAAAERPPSYQPASPIHFNQFVTQVGERAADADQRVMAFAFYFWNFEKKDEFGVEEIASFFRTVQDAPPDDLDDRLIDLAERRRFLEPGTVEGAWKLTQKGVNYVKNRLLGPA